MSPLLKKRSNKDDKYTLRLYCLISGVLALAIMYFTLLCHENTLAFGENTVLRMDLYHQYGPLYAELYDRVVNGYSLVYSWTSGLGGSFIGNLFNYCCSPFAFIILLVGHENMPEAIAIMMMLYAVFSSVTFTYYINKTTESVNKLSIGFGLLYAFSGYFVAYSWNIMWLDAMSVFPLVILGIEKIIQKNKPGLYIFTMTFTMITNYYMAYMVCVLSVLYFLYFYVSRYESGAKMVTEKAEVESAESEENASAVTLDENGFHELTDEAFYVENSTALTENEIFEHETELVDAAATVDELQTTTEQPDTAAVDSAVEFTEESADVVIANISESTAEQNADNEKAEKRKRKRQKKELSNSRFWITGWSFALSSLLCFFISAFALLPVWYCLQTSSATGGSLPSTFKVYFNLFDFVANHLPALTTTIRSSGDVVLPNIYCGLLTLMLLPLYFFSNKVTGRRKVTAIVFLGIFYISFATNYMNYFWHGMHMPNDLPFRYSFGYSFVLLILAYNVLLNIDEFSNRVFVGVGVAVVGFVMLIDKTGSHNVGNKTVTLSVALAIIYVVFLGMYKSKKFDKGAVAALLVIAVVTEVCLADISNYIMAQPKVNYVSDYDDYLDITEVAERNDDTLFYRTEQSKLRARMDPCWFGYNGVSTFSSMAYEHVANLMDKMGMFGNVINSYTYYPQTPIFNSMFALRYIYDNSNIIDEGDFYSYQGQNDSFTAYKYQYFLPLAFTVRDTVTNWDTTSSNPFEVQNSLMKSAAGVGNILQTVEATDISGSNIAQELSLEGINELHNITVSRTNDGEYAEVDVCITTERDGQYFIYAGCSGDGDVDITADDYSFRYNSSDPFILDIGNHPADTEIHVKYILGDGGDATVKFRAACLNKTAFEKAYKNINSYGLFKFDDFSETEFSGKVKMNGSGNLLYTSIPFDESWQIRVDGELLEYNDVDIVKIGDALIGVRVPSGEHDVSFKYVPRGLGTGIKLTVFGLTYVVLLILWKLFLGEFLRKKGIVFKIARTPDMYIK